MVLWKYEKFDTEVNRRVIDRFDWLRAWSNVNVDEKGSYFTKLLLNIIHNFIPYKTIVCDDRDSHWTKRKFLKMVKKNNAYKSHCCSNRNTILFQEFKVVQNELNILMEDFINKGSTLNW